MKNTNWILTFTGKHIFPLESDAKDIDMIDIAHALSNICRFTGHCKEFYSVAQHSVHVAEMVIERHPEAKEMALAALLHDASEAYLCDIAKPVKECSQFGYYREAEEYLQHVIFQKFGIPGYWTTIKQFDYEMLCVEAYFLMPECDQWEATFEEPNGWEYQKEFICWSPKEAKERFLKMFNELARECGINF